MRCLPELIALKVAKRVVGRVPQAAFCGASGRGQARGIWLFPAYRAAAQGLYWSEEERRTGSAMA
jgi:hypothetical protein